MVRKGLHGCKKTSVNLAKVKMLQFIAASLETLTIPL